MVSKEALDPNAFLSTFLSVHLLVIPCVSPLLLTLLFSYSTLVVCTLCSCFCMLPLESFSHLGYTRPVQFLLLSTFTVSVRLTKSACAAVFSSISMFLSPSGFVFVSIGGLS